jgi:ABC-2 type transport system permease protein
MSFSLKRVGAILIKELQDIKSNWNVIYMYLLPLLLTYLFGNFIPDMPEGFALGFGLLFMVVMVGMYVPSMIIAEEKEKKTLEVLLLSPATAVEVFTGKGLVIFVSMLITTFFLLLLSGSGFEHLGVIIPATIVASIFSIFLGTMVGLLAPNQISTGLIGTPIYMLLYLVPLLGGMGVDVMNKIGVIMPTSYYFEMLELVFTENLGLGDMLPQMGVLSLSAVLTLALVLLVYRKKGIE